MIISILEQKDIDDEYNLALFHCDIAIVRKGNKFTQVTVGRDRSELDDGETVDIEQLPEMIRRLIIENKL